MRATLSLLGLYNYDNTVLDGLTLPDNFESGDLETLKMNLLIETAEFEILYPDPSFLKLAITQWCSKRKSTWKWLKETQQYDYVPIWNADYNRYNTRDLTQTEDETTDFTRNLTDTKSGDDTSKLSGRDTITLSGDDQVTLSGDDKITLSGDDQITLSGDDKITLSGDDETTLSGDDTSLHSVYAFNDQATGAPDSSDKVDYGKVETTDYGKVETTDYGKVETTDYGKVETTDYGKVETTDYGKVETTDYGKQDRMTYNSAVDYTGTTKTERDFDRTDAEKNHEVTQGNYGTTTTQYMIQEEQKLAQFNLLDYIIEDFKKRFCLLVY